MKHTGIIHASIYLLLLINFTSGFSILRPDSTEKEILPPLEISRNKINLHNHAYPISSIAFSADNQYFYTIGDDHCAKVWNFEKEEVARTVYFEHLNLSTNHSLSVQVLPSGRVALFVGSSVEIWSALLEEKLTSYSDSSGFWLFDPFLTKDEKYFIQVSFNGIKIINLLTGASEFECLKVEKDKYGNPIRFFHGGGLVNDTMYYALTMEGVRTFNLLTHESSLIKLRDSVAITQHAEVSFSNDGKYLVYFSQLNALKGDYTSIGFLYNLKSKNRINFVNYDSFSKLSKFASDNRTFYTSSRGGFKKMTIKENYVIQTVVTSQRGHGRGMAFNSNKTMVSVCQPDYWTSNIDFYKVVDNQRIKSIKQLPQSARSFSFTETGEILMGENDGHLFLYNTKSNKLASVKETKKYFLQSAVKAGPYLGLYSREYLKDYALKRTLTILQQHSDSLSEVFRDSRFQNENLAFDINPVKGWLAFRDEDTVYIFDLKSGKTIQKIHSKIRTVNDITFSSNGDLLIIDSKLFNTRDQQWIELWPNDPEHYVRNARFSADDKLLFVLFDNLNWHIYDVSTLKPVLQATITETGYSNKLNAAFTPDNNFIGLSTSNHVYVWDIALGKVVAVQNGNYTDLQYKAQPFGNNQYSVIKYANAFWFKRE